ncbi:MAG: phosphatase PAP2 family protein [Chromatiaceae bacterium]|nr:phosphatase PAP2 family protein [Chromatiaceae bacterium]
MSNITWSDKKFYLLIFGYFAVMLLLDVAGIDIWLASKWYSLQGHQWALQDYWLTEQVLHKGARKLNYLFALAVLLTTGYYRFIDKSQPRRASAYLALTLSLLASFALVAYLKSITNVACPWSLSLFGGSEPYYHLLQHRPTYLPYSRCFPAGHASVGYAWVALYYFFKHTQPDYRYIGLATGLIAGLILGLNQQLRGAHFMSHDITTLLICLLCAKSCFAWLNPSYKRQN